MEDCYCSNELQARERASFYIIKMKPNLNDEKMDEKCLDIIPGVQGVQGVQVVQVIPDFKPNILADKVVEAIVNIEGKYVCLCKKSYSHRSSYYKHTSTCLQFQHCQATNKKPNIDTSLNTVSVSIVATTTTTTTTTTSIMTAHEETVAVAVAIDGAVADDDDDNTEMVRYRFKSKKKAIKMDESSDNIYQYLPEPNSELSVQISEKPSYSYSDGDDADEASSSDSESSISLDDDDAISALSVTTDATAASSVSELLTEQNDKLKEYIRKMITALTMDKKRSKKSLVNSLVFELLDQNKTLQKQIVELSKERNIIVNNTNNNQFNLNFFLNEQCKDAVNISDFVDSLEITMDDLTYTRDQGLVEGISKVMIDGLKQIDLYKRPIHCTDQKRDTIYIRDNHQWARDEGNARMRQVFVDIANKEYFAVKKWMDLHPGWETNSRLQDFHHKMIRNVLHEIKDDPIGERKIMKSIERETFIEK